METAKVLSLTLSTLSHATEDRNKVLRAAEELCPEGCSGKLETRRVKGHHGNEIIVIQIRSASARQAERCFEHFWSRLAVADQGRIRSRMEDSTNSGGTLFIRIDKGESYKGKILLGDSDAIRIEVRFAVHGMSGDLMLRSIENRLIAITDFNSE